MAGYTRNDVQNNIADGNVINASDLDGEFDALTTAFNATSGHNHDGTAYNGAPITKIGPNQDLVTSGTGVIPKTNNTLDLGSASFKFKNLYLAGIAVPKVQTVTSATTISPSCDTADLYTVTALAAAATIAAPSGTPVEGQRLVLRFKDNGTARALTWTTSSGGYRAVGVLLPSTTNASKTTYVGCIYNSTDSFWDVVAVGEQV